MRKKIEPTLKAKVAMEALKGDKTIAEISSAYGVHATQVTQGKQELANSAEKIFIRSKDPKEREREELIENLYRSIGEISVENDWLKKKLAILE